jgi:hypothetical protein
LPASWDHADVKYLRLPGGDVDVLHFIVAGDQLKVDLTALGRGGWHLRSDIAGAKSVDGDGQSGLRIPLPALDIDPLLSRFPAYMSDERPLPNRPPIPGARTCRFRILRSEYRDGKLTLVVEGPAGGQSAGGVIRRDSGVSKIAMTHSGSEGDATLSGYPFLRFTNPPAQSLLEFKFPPGEGWKTITVTLSLESVPE